MLLLSRVLSGFGAANVAVIQAFVSDQTGKAERSAALGRVGAALSAGLVIGPTLGGFLAAQGGNHLVGFTAGIASLLGAVWMMFALPSPAPVKAQDSSDGHTNDKPKRAPTIDLRLLRDFPQLRRLALIAVVAWLSLATLEGTFARLISHLYGYDQRQFGVIFGYESLLGIIVQVVLLAAISRRFTDTRLLRFAYLAQGAGLALNPFAGALMPTVIPFVVLIVASTFYAVGSGLSNPTVNSLCSQLTPDDRQGELFGLLQGARSVGFVVGPIVGGMLFDWRPAAPYLFAGAVCVAAAALVPGRKEMEQR